MYLEVKRFSSVCPTLPEVGLTIAHAMANRLARNQASGSFGARLRRLRSERALTQEELGSKVGLSKRMVAYYEIQQGTPSAPLASKFAHALGVSLDELMGGRRSEGEKTPRSAAELRLWRKFRRVQQLPERDRRAVLQLID